MPLILSFCLLCFAMHVILVSLIPKLESHILGFRGWQVCIYNNTWYNLITDYLFEKKPKDFYHQISSFFHFFFFFF